VSRYSTFEWVCVLIVLTVCVTRITVDRPHAADYGRTALAFALTYLLARIVLGVASW